jgi:hypothetical protein
VLQLKPPIGMLDEGQLKNLVNVQRGRRDTVVSTLRDATGKVEARRKAAVASVPAFGDVRRVGNTETRVLTHDDQLAQQSFRSHAEKQTVRDILQIRQDTDKLLVPVLKQMNLDADRAREMSERTHDKLSILRRTRGPFSGTGSFQQAMEARATYREILRDSEPIELARWAQYCIDAGDPMSLIIADAVLRDNFTRQKVNRPFMNATLLDLLTVPEFDTAQVHLREIVMLAQEAGTAFAAFGREIGAASTRRIALGLAKQGIGLPGDQPGVPIQGAE